MGKAIITDTLLTGLGDVTREISGHNFTYTPEEMAEELSEYSVKQWERPEEWPDYDALVKRADPEKQFLYLTCMPTEDNYTVTFYTRAKGDSNSACLVETGTWDGETGFTAESSEENEYGNQYSIDLSTARDITVIRVTAVNDGDDVYVWFASGWNVKNTGPVVEVWGRICDLTDQMGRWSLTEATAIDVLYKNGANNAIQRYAFHDCGAEYINVRRWGTPLSGNQQNIFSGCSSLSTLDVGNWDTSGATSMSSLFSNCGSLTSLDVSSWDLSGVTTIQNMFQNCSSLAALDVSAWDLSSVTTMAGAFYGCSSLASLDVSGWDVSSVTSMQSMFHSCSSLASLDANSWDTRNVASMAYLFNNCASLTDLDLNSWDTSAVTTMQGMFSGCGSLVSLDISSWDTSAVTTMAYLFYNCTSLTDLDLSGWDTGSLTTANTMFYNCKALTSLDMSGCDMAALTVATNMFYYCTALTDFQPPKMYISFKLSNCSVLSDDSIQAVIDCLQEVEETQTLSLHSTVKAKLTDDQITAANDRGWTIA